MEELKPITRKETYLAKAAGQDVTTPTPVTREEMFLDAIAKGGGGGGGGSSGGGVLVVHEDWDTADGQLDKTWQEISEAPFCVLDTGSGRSIFYKATYSTDEVVEYNVYFYDIDFSEKQKYTTNSPSGYPVYAE